MNYKKSKIEFFITPEGVVMINDVIDGVTELKMQHRDLIGCLLEIIQHQYPEAYNALSEEYKSSSLNMMYYDFLRVHRFIRCNFGKFDNLTFDIDCGVMHLEEVSCPIRCECKMAGIICKPKPFGLTERETEIAKRISEGKTYEEVSEELGISESTIKNFLQTIKKKLNLKSSKDITKIMVANSI